MRVFAVGWVALVVWGCDSDESSRARPSVDGGTADSGVLVPEPIVSCGSMAGLQQGSPWPMRMGCPTHQSRTDAIGPAEPQIAWQTEDLGGRLTGATLDANGTIYNVQNSSLYAWNPEDGQLLWEYSDSTQQVFGQPTLGSDGNIYLTPRDNEGLHAVNRETMQAAWTVPLPGDSWSSPVIGADGTIYAARTSLYAIDPQTRAVKWEATMPNINESSPSIGLDGTLYVGSTTGLIRAFAPEDGQQLWSYQADDAVWSTVALANGNVYFGSHDGNVRALDERNGELVWTFDVGAEVRSSPAISRDGHMHIGARDGNVYKLDGFSGDLIWIAELDAGEVRSTPLIDGNGDVYVGASNKQLYSLDGRSGAVRWSIGLGGNGVEASPALSPDGTLYASSNRTFAIVDATLSP